MSANIICSICFADYRCADEVISTTCGHIFHKNCLQTWIVCSQTCPQCREHCTVARKIFPQFAETADRSSDENLKLKEELEKCNNSLKKIQDNLLETEGLYADLLERFQLLRMQHEEESKKNLDCLQNIENMKQQAEKEKNSLSSVKNELERFKFNEAYSCSLINTLEDELNILSKKLNIEMNSTHPKPKDELSEQIINLIKNVSFMERVSEKNKKRSEISLHGENEKDQKKLDYSYQKHTNSVNNCIYVPPPITVGLGGYLPLHFSHPRRQLYNKNPKASIMGSNINNNRQNPRHVNKIPIIDPETNRQII